MPSRTVYACAECGEEFATPRGLAGHQRKHALKVKECPECGGRFKYLESHRLRSHGVGKVTDPVNALLRVLAELETLRAEVRRYRARYGVLDD